MQSLSERGGKVAAAMTTHNHLPRLPCMRFASQRRYVVPSKRFFTKARAEDEETREQELRITGEAMKVDDQRGETIGEKLERVQKRRSMRAERLANKTVEPDFESSNWAGDQYIGSSWNVLSVILLIAIVVPLLGLVFAYFSYGVLWGLGPQAI